MKIYNIWKNPVEPVIIFGMLLALCGVVSIFSASFVMASVQLGDAYFFLKKHLFSFFLGLMVMIVVAKTNYQRWKSILPFLMFVVIVLLILVQISGIGIVVNGARRWIKLGSFLFQPSEIAKPVVVIVTASYLSYCLKKKKRVSLLSWPIIFFMAVAALIQMQPDMSTAVTIVGVCLVLYIIAGLDKKEISLIAIVGAVMAVLLIYVATYRATRVLAWFDPWSYQQSIGYQTVQSIISIGSGGILGAGLGRGMSKFFYLPEAHTDFIFAIWCQETGFIGAFILLTVLAAFAFFVMQVALKTEDEFGSFLTIGALFFIVGQALVNMAMVVGLLPVMGVPFPFLSYGGTSLIVNLFLLGLIISVARKIAPRVIIKKEVSKI